MDIQEKLNVLTKIAERLNGAGVVWAVGASLLLYLKGIADDFHDIDIMISEDTADKAKEVLTGMGALLPTRADMQSQYRTRHFWEFEIDGVEVDAMEGFAIVSDGTEHYFPLEEKNVHGYADVNGVPVPLQSVADWRDYYALMHRDAKVRLIDGWRGAMADNAYPEHTVKL